MTILSSQSFVFVVLVVVAKDIAWSLAIIVIIVVVVVMYIMVFVLLTLLPFENLSKTLRSGEDAIAVN
jgi:hypothetical protein